MHVELSDLLTCPRCGPTYGLILLPSAVRDRRVESGVLGCANCRERYAVEGGVPDLRVGAGGVEGVEGVEGVAGVEGVEGVEEPEREEAVRLAALLGLSEGGGTVLVAGPAAARAGVLSELVPEVRIVAIGATGAEGGVESGAGAGGSAGSGSGVTWLRADATLPFRAGGLRGVALTGGWAERVEEASRLVGPAGRVVLDPAPAGGRARGIAAGLTVLLEEGGVLVAGRGR